MRAKQKNNYIQREFAPPQTTNPEVGKQRWDQRQAEARALEAQLRAKERRGKQPEGDHAQEAI